METSPKAGDKNYCVFRFTSPNKHTRAVPANWLLDKETCFYPHKVAKISRLNQLLKDRIPYHSDGNEWEAYHGFVLKEGLSLETAKNKAEEDGRRNYVGSLTSDSETQTRRRRKTKSFEPELSAEKSALPKAPRSPGPNKDSTMTPPKSTPPNQGSTSKWEVTSAPDFSKLEATKKTLFLDLDDVGDKERKSPQKNVPDASTSNSKLMTPVKADNTYVNVKVDAVNPVVLSVDKAEKNISLGKHPASWDKPGPSHRDVYEEMLESEDSIAEIKVESEKSKKKEQPNFDFRGDGSTWPTSEFQRYMVMKVRKIEAKQDILVADSAPRRDKKTTPIASTKDNVEDQEQKLSTQMDIMKLDSYLGEVKARKNWVKKKVSVLCSQVNASYGSNHVGRLVINNIFSLNGKLHTCFAGRSVGKFALQGSNICAALFDIMSQLGFSDKTVATKALSKPLYKANDGNTRKAPKSTKKKDENNDFEKIISSEDSKEG